MRRRLARTPASRQAAAYSAAFFISGIDALRRLLGAAGAQRDDLRLFEGEAQRLPDVDQRLDQVGDLRLAVRAASA